MQKFCYNMHRLNGTNWHQTCENVYAIFQLSFHFAYHRWWLGSSSRWSTHSYSSTSNRLSFLLSSFFHPPPPHFYSTCVPACPSVWTRESASLKISPDLSSSDSLCSAFFFSSFSCNSTTLSDSCSSTLASLSKKG